mmetsp:Transcript_9477/g.27088  ORF Transcript_9477/g.27088 Transcript_9477/m.27088 type:complete len:333 (+) Transcript_9477:1683-2681(+)
MRHLVDHVLGIGPGLADLLHAGELLLQRILAVLHKVLHLGLLGSSLAAQAGDEGLLQLLHVLLHSVLHRQHAHGVAVDLHLHGDLLSLLGSELEILEVELPVGHLLQPLVDKGVQVHRAQGNPVLQLLQLLVQLGKQNLRGGVHLSNAARGSFHHVPEESRALRGIADALEVERQGDKGLDVLLVVGRAQLLQRGVVLQLALLEHHLELHLRQGLIEALQPLVVLVLQRLVDLIVPMQPPVGLARAGEALVLEVIEDCADVLDAGHPLVSLPNQVCAHQGHHLLPQHLVPFPQLTVLLSQAVGHLLQACDVSVQGCHVGPGQGLPETIPRVG